MTPDGLITFGPFELDTHTLELRLGSAQVPLEPRPTRLLIRLVERRNQMVTRRELRELGWPRLPGAAEQSLNTCIHQIRQALARDGDQSVRLETLRGRGYRLSCPEESAAPPQGVGGRTRGARWRRPVAAAWVMGATALTAGLVWLLGTGVGQRPTLAAADRLLDQAEYLVEETHDLEAALAVLDTGRVVFPEVAEIHALWAELHLFKGDQVRAREGAERALTVEPATATARRTLGALGMMRSDWSEAEHNLERALRLDPADTRTLAALAYLRTIQRRFDEAAALIEEATATDPLSVTIHQDAGLMYLLMGRYSLADERCREALRFRPESRWTLNCLFDTAVLSGREADAAAWGLRLLALDGDTAASRAAWRQGTASRTAIARVRTHRLRRLQTAHHRHANPLDLAMAYASAGMTDEGLDALREAVARPTPGVLAVGVDPRLAPLREHRMFEQVVGPLRLPVASL